MKKEYVAPEAEIEFFSILSSDIVYTLSGGHEQGPTTGDGSDPWNPWSIRSSGDIEWE